MSELASIKAEQAHLATLLAKVIARNLLLAFDTPSDGSCQFHALAIASPQSSDPAMSITAVRTAVLTELANNKARYEQHVTGSFNIWLAALQAGWEWGDHVSLQAFANATGITVTVLTSLTGGADITVSPAQSQAAAAPAPPAHQIVIGHYFLRHYFGTRRPHDPAPQAPMPLTIATLPDCLLNRLPKFNAAPHVAQKALSDLLVHLRMRGGHPADKSVYSDDALQQYICKRVPMSAAAMFGFLESMSSKLQGNMPRDWNLLRSAVKFKVAGSTTTIRANARLSTLQPANILAAWNRIVASEKRIRVVDFGCACAPELYALALFLRVGRKRESPARIEVIAFDRVSSWKKPFSAMMDVMRTDQIDVTGTLHTVDITADGALDDLITPSIDIVIASFMISEQYADGSFVRAFAHAADQCAIGSFVFIQDRDIKGMLPLIGTLLQRGFVVFYEFHRTQSPKGGVKVSNAEFAPSNVGAFAQMAFYVTALVKIA